MKFMKTLDSQLKENFSYEKPTNILENSGGTSPSRVMKKYSMGPCIHIHPRTTALPPPNGQPLMAKHA